jgi:5'-3' exonuclease
MVWANPRPALVVDGLSVFHSVAGPAAKLTNGYAYSFVASLTSAVKKFKPNGIVVCWDGGSVKRKALHPEYKANRPSSMNDTLRGYLEDVKRFLRAVGADQLHAVGYEADDIGAMLANTMESAVLVSNDKDWLQLVRPGISVYHRCRVEGRKNEKKEITTSNFAEVTGWSNPEELVRGLCAMGDGVDNITGLENVGVLTVRKYLMGMNVGPVKQEQLDTFFNNSPLYLKNKALIELRDVREVPGLTCDMGIFDEEKVKSLLEELGFASMLKKFPEWVQPYKEAYEDLSTTDSSAGLSLPTSSTSGPSHKEK